MSSFLCTVVSFAVFHSIGTTPVLRVDLNRDTNGGSTVHPSSLSNLGATSSGPVALFVFRFSILLLTIPSWMLMTAKVGISAESFAMPVSNGSAGRYAGNCVASFVPIEEK